MIVGYGPIALAVGAVGGCSDIFTLLYLFSCLLSSLWETAPTNQPEQNGLIKGASSGIGIEFLIDGAHKEP